MSLSSPFQQLQVAFRGAHFSVKFPEEDYREVVFLFGSEGMRITSFKLDLTILFCFCLGMLKRYGEAFQNVLDGFGAERDSLHNVKSYVPQLAQRGADFL